MISLFIFVVCFNTVLSKILPGLNQEKHLDMREEELNLVRTIDKEVFKDGPWKMILSAAQDCNIQKVEEQIKRGTDVNIKNERKWSALYVASRISCEHVVEFLIRNRADVNTKCDEEWTSLHWAAYNGKINIAQILIMNGAEKNVGDIYGLTPLHLAVHRGREQMVNFLIAKGVAMNVKCNKGWTPLFTAAFKGNVQIAILLIQNGMDVNDTDLNRWTPLHVASYEGYTLIIRLLLRKGTNVNAADQDGFTSIHLAAQEGNDKTIEMLLNYGASIDPITNDGRTPLFIAVYKDHSIKHIYPYSAISRGREEMVELLLRHGANPNFKYVEGWSIFHEAVEKGNERIVDLLIKYGAKVNVQDSDKWTPLHSACKQGHRKVVELLVKNGTLSYKDNNGKSPLDIALTRGDMSIIELVKSVPTPAQYACKIYLKLPINRVLGGKPADPGEFPWMAALGYLNPNGKMIYNCGGTLISEFFIMTAAHCVRQSRPPFVVRLGKLTLTDNDGIQAANFQIQEIIRHPNYSFITKRNDIALIRVGKRINFTSEIVPACLQTDLRDEIDMDLLATGWGSIDSDRIILSNTLQKTQLTSMPLNECNATLLEFNKDVNQAALRNGIGAGQYCAYDPQARNDSCQGDSGGPLQYFADKESGIATVLGIISVGFGCGTALPSLYTRVAAYLDWIEPIVWPTA